ncbi:hypothetical protein BCR44DRAFT_1438412 [Catenaria anguillulae PL171]|uniref:Pre-mRNA-splicing factor SYF1 n=1 Tax=Catenaria anguillulae PL171 TaxID=765915 RepID=A0A1Y2HHP5_9FUNG|nr:hypothetical protein BCR44DRAFT_1438412 [Catenaria anguillulae PL171]
MDSSPPSPTESPTTLAAQSGPGAAPGSHDHDQHSLPTLPLLDPPAHPQSTAAAVVAATLHPTDHPFEADLLRDPYSPRTWLRYIAHKEAHVTLGTVPHSHLALLYERATHHLPGSYKLWKAYLDWSVVRLRATPTPPEPNAHSWPRTLAVQRVLGAYQRALVTLHKMPRIWLDFLSLAVNEYPGECMPGTLRQWFDRALQALPVTQHDRIWELYLPWTKRYPDIAIHVHKRYLKLDPTHASAYVTLLMDSGNHALAATHVLKSLDSAAVTDDPVRTAALFDKLFSLLTSHPTALPAHLAEQVLRAGIRRMPTHAAKFHVALARMHLANGHMARARDVFEQAMRSVVSLRDFTQVFDAYLEVEEVAVQVGIKRLAKLTKRAKKKNADLDADLKQELDNVQVDVDMRLARLDRLTRARPVLVNDVLLRQNPHSVGEWVKRATNLVPGRDTWEQAIKTIHPKHAVDLHKVWTGYARYYEVECKDVEGARAVWERAVKVDFKTVGELVSVWTEYAEMELRAAEIQRARDVMGRACSVPKGAAAKAVDFKDTKLSSQRRLFKSLPLWSFYVDLEECFGTRATVAACYDSMLSLKIATPQVVVNYALYLESQGYWEDAFKVYERGIALFPYPIAQDLWAVYIPKFMRRFGLTVDLPDDGLGGDLFSTHAEDNDQDDQRAGAAASTQDADGDFGMAMERLRDLFDASLALSPMPFRSALFTAYAAVELRHGLARRALRVLDRALFSPTLALDPPLRKPMVSLAVLIASTHFGLLSARPIYERVLPGLPDKHAAQTCMEWAALELRVAISNAKYWAMWRAFEVGYGNEETFKDMLRVKRSVAAKFNTDANYIRMVVAGERAKREREREAEERERVERERREKERQVQFVAASSNPAKVAALAGAKEQGEVGELDDLDLMDVDDDDEAGESGAGDEVAANKVHSVQQKAVPMSLFGKLADKIQDEEKQDAKEVTGAKARLASAKNKC